jgi:predicted amidophosphoribosyltransferase
VLRPDAETGFVWPPKAPEDDTTEHPGGVDTSSIDQPVDPRPGGLVPLLRRLEADLLGGRGGLRGLETLKTDPPGNYCPRCGETVGVGEVDEAGCGACRGRRLAWSRAVRLGPYHGPLRDAIVACKYRSDRTAGRDLGRRLGHALLRAFDLADADTAGALLVPVPTTTRRRLSNGGVDHALILAREVGRALAVRPTRLLERRHRERQAGLPASARARNLAGTIRARSLRPGPTPSEIVLVDDVRTTGATATTCLRTIRAALGERGGRRGERSVRGPRCWLVTAAVSTKRRADAHTGGEVPGHA